MTPADPAFRFRVDCPGCKRPLGVPPAAVGAVVHCPHCKATFDLPAGPDGAPGTPVVRRRRGVPRLLAGPAFGLILLGVAGTFVGGLLAVQFATVPGADRAYARALLRQIRGIEAGSTTAVRPTGDDWEQLPFAAVAGAGVAVGSNDVLEDARDDRVAEAWRPGVAPANRVSLALSVLTLAGGVCVVAGRFYWLALAGCVAAAANVNHLCCVPGAVVGVWGVLMLVRDEGRGYFRR